MAFLKNNSQSELLLRPQFPVDPCFPGQQNVLNILLSRKAGFKFEIASARFLDPPSGRI